MINANVGVEVGAVGVATSDNGGHPPEVWASGAIEQIAAISEDAPPHIRQQAEAFRERLYEVVLRNVKSAIFSDRTTLAYLLNSQGHADLAKILKEL